MSDMTGPAPPPPARAHQEHDPLLVSQVAAGDPVDPARAAEAQTWLRTCPTCAALAADLRHISAALASEPTPPRRRDFRLTAEQAERLQGNAVTRFLRRLSAPRARALGPAAAGVLSVGLLFVVAGYVVPDDGAVTLQSDANVVSAPAEAPAASAPAPALEAAPAAPLTAPPAAADEGVRAYEGAPAEEAMPADAIEFFAANPELAEELAEHQAGMSARAKAGADASEAELSDDLAPATEVEREALEPEALVPADGMADTFAEESDQVVRPGGRLQDVQAPDLGAAAVGDELRTATDEVEGTVAGQVDPAPIDGAADPDTSVDDDGLGRWLMVTGLVLVLGGGLVLLLVLIARRRRDPLLR